jgi:hypothetical protein
MEYTRTVTGEVDLQVAEVLDIKENKIIASSVSRIKLIFLNLVLYVYAKTDT